MSLPILDVAIGLSFVYLLLGLICTTFNEMLAGLRKTRANFLDRGIGRLLGGDDDLKRRLFEHPLIRSLSATDSKLCPSYIPSDRFATALMDILSGPGKAPNDVAAVIAGVKSIGNDTLRASLTALLDEPQPDASSAKSRIEKWFDEGMDRVSGWYKRNAQRNALVLASIVTLLLNADTLHIAQVLWTSPSTRAAVVEEARIRSQKSRPEELLPMVEYPNPQDPTASSPVKVPSDQALSPGEQELLGQLTGWDGDFKLFKGDGFSAFSRWIGIVLWMHGFGWIMTALAVSLGAPFWFDTLNRFMNIRNAGRAPDERRDKSRSAVASSH